MVGAGGLTLIIGETMHEPPVLVAVIVKLVGAVIVLGVPLILPLAVSKSRPFGKAGLIAQEMAAPPVLLGMSVEMGTLMMNA
jgi:hypothetical protein